MKIRRRLYNGYNDGRRNCLICYYGSVFIGDDLWISISENLMNIKKIIAEK